MANDLYQAIFVRTWPWWAGGIIIGLLVPLLYVIYNVGLGASTGYGSVLKLFLAKTRLKWFNSSTFAERWGWRVFFLIGMIAGGFVSARLAGRPLVTSEMGLFTETVHWPLIAEGLFFMLGGVLLALGARLAGGCTSGHSIQGIANLQVSSMVATALFVTFGVVSTWLVRTFVLGGAR